MSGSDHLKPARSGVTLTYDDFMMLPDDGKRHELINGEHYVTPSPNTKHQRVSFNLTMLIGGWLETHAVGRLFYAPFDVVLSEFDVVEPDLLYMSAARAIDILTPQHARGAPDLVIEISSPGTRGRDETIKRTLYDRGPQRGSRVGGPERSGVLEYWIVDPEIDVIRVYRRTDERFGRPIELSREAGDVVTTLLLPGLEIPLVRVFQE